VVRIALAVVILLVAIGLATTGPTLGADPDKAREDVFAGKIVVLSLKSTDKYGATLEKVQVKNLGGKAFLVGTGVDTGQPGNWVVGRTVWIPLEDIVQIVEFTNLEQLKNAESRP
jgi:hypothetical protein